MDVAQIVTTYKRMRKAPGKIKSVTDAQMYAEQVGSLLAKIIGVNPEMTAEEMEPILLALLKEARGDINRVMQIAIRKTTQAAGLGLEPIVSPLVTDGLSEMAAELVAEKLTPEGVKTLMQSRALGIADDTLRENAKAHSELNLPVHIVRTYSDVGLRSGTKYAETCQWCMDRCGEWFDYDEAYNAGCFERHPGCLCTIDYNVGETHDVIFGGR